jgi:hypothetical protein
MVKLWIMRLFLSDLQVNAVQYGWRFHHATSSGSLLFRVVTQKYGKGIVQYGSTSTSSFPGSAGAYGGNGSIL